MSVSVTRYFGLAVGMLWALAISVSVAKGVLEITSDPGGAKVYVDGARNGMTPKQFGKALVLELEEGEYRLELVLEGARTMRVGETINVVSGATSATHLEIACPHSVDRPTAPGPVAGLPFSRSRFL